MVQAWTLPVKFAAAEYFLVAYAADTEEEVGADDSAVAVTELKAPDCCTRLKSRRYVPHCSCRKVPGYAALMTKPQASPTGTSHLTN